MGHLEIFPSPWLGNQNKYLENQEKAKKGINPGTFKDIKYENWMLLSNIKAISTKINKLVSHHVDNIIKWRKYQTSGLGDHCSFSYSLSPLC